MKFFKALFGNKEEKPEEKKKTKRQKTSMYLNTTACALCVQVRQNMQ